ncbi:IS3 family transposase [Peribacillus psychrosaccharolyticus]
MLFEFLLQFAGYYYNHQRIKVKLKGMSPVDDRVHALKAA